MSTLATLSVFLDSCGLFSCCTQTPPTDGAILSASEPAGGLLQLCCCCCCCWSTHTLTHTLTETVSQAGFLRQRHSLHGARLNSFCAVLSGYLRSERGLLRVCVVAVGWGSGAADCCPAVSDSHVRVCVCVFTQLHVKPGCLAAPGSTHGLSRVRRRLFTSCLSSCRSLFAV